MNNPFADSRSVLTMVRLPARSDCRQAAELLGVQIHDVHTLTRVKLLRPLGSPEPNAPKYFSTAELQVLAADRAWLDKAQKAIQAHWRRKNGQRSEDVD